MVDSCIGTGIEVVMLEILQAWYMHVSLGMNWWTAE